MLTASDDDTVTSVTSLLSLTTPSESVFMTAFVHLRSSLRKISQALTLTSTEAPLTSSSNPGPEKPIDPKAEYDRLMHARKGISGSEFAGLGIQFAVTIVLFAFAGIWLDRRLGSSPAFVIIMVLGGAGLGFWVMYRRATKR